MKHLKGLLAVCRRAAIVLLFVIGLLGAVSSRASAVTPPAGTACCDPGYTFKQSGSGRTSYCQKDVCADLFATLCSPANILQAGGTRSIMGTICEDGGRKICQVNYNRFSTTGQIAQNTCTSTWWLEPSPALKALGLDNNGKRYIEWALPAPVAAACSSFFSLNVAGVELTKDTYCSANQGCSANNTCIEERWALCDQVGSDYQDQCISCLENKGLWTAVGCVESSADGIVSAIMIIGLGVAGGLALIMILVAGFMLTTSQGEPKRTGEAKEMLQAAVIGLLFIIFSVTILQFIGVTILRIPGFGGP